MNMRLIPLIFIGTLLVFGCETPATQTQDAPGDVQAEAQVFIDAYTATFKRLYYAAAEAEWASNTRIVEGDTMTPYKTRMANEAYADFTGSVENIEKARGLRCRRLTSFIVFHTV